VLSKKSFWGTAQIFLEALMRWSENDVGGHIIYRISKSIGFPTGSLRKFFMSHCTPEYWFRLAHREIFGQVIFAFFDSIGPSRQYCG
jgi:hypothetical protein